MLEVKPHDGTTTFLVESETRACSRPGCDFKRKFAPTTEHKPCAHCGSAMEKRFVYVDLMEMFCGCEAHSFNAGKLPAGEFRCKHLHAAMLYFAQTVLDRLKAQQNQAVSAW
jgi:hypothetical protein